MATTQALSFPALVLRDSQTFAQLPQYGALDDFAAMAVLATLSMLYLSKGILWNRPDPYLYKLYERPQEHLAGQNTSQCTRDIKQKLEQIVRSNDTY
jgi:NADPH-ferrihemoprotein reductase